jgi:hypothetical protein
MDSDLPDDVLPVFDHLETADTFVATLKRDHHDVTRVYEPRPDDGQIAVTEIGSYHSHEVYRRELRPVPCTTNSDDELVTTYPGDGLRPREFARLNGFDEADHRLGVGFSSAVEDHGNPRRYYRLKRNGGEPPTED